MEEPFYELYQKLARGRQDLTEAFPYLDELARVCRDRKNAGDTSQGLSDADDCLYEIAGSSVLFAEAISRWLTNDEDVELGKALLHKASVKYLRRAALEAFDVSRIEESRAILTGCRLCALAPAVAVSLGWALSLALHFSSSDRAQQAVDRILEYHSDEFPLTTHRLLSAEGSPFDAVEKVKAMLTHLMEENTWLQDLSPLREFSMTPEMRLTHSSLKRNESRAIHRKAGEMSVFGQLFSAKHFKYASRTAIEVVADDEVQETIVEMSPFSMSIELPLSERTDPVSGMIRRRSLWEGLA